MQALPNHTANAMQSTTDKLLEQALGEMSQSTQEENRQLAAELITMTQNLDDDLRFKPTLAVRLASWIIYSYWLIPSPPITPDELKQLLGDILSRSSQPLTTLNNQQWQRLLNKCYQLLSSLTHPLPEGCIESYQWFASQFGISTTHILTLVDKENLPHTEALPSTHDLPLSHDKLAALPSITDRNNTNYIAVNQAIILERIAARDSRVTAAYLEKISKLEVTKLFFESTDLETALLRPYKLHHVPCVTHMHYWQERKHTNHPHEVALSLPEIPHDSFRSASPQEKADFITYLKELRDSDDPWLNAFGEILIRQTVRAFSKLGQPKQLKNLFETLGITVAQAKGPLSIWQRFRLSVAGVESIQSTLAPAITLDPRITSTATASPTVREADTPPPPSEERQAQLIALANTLATEDAETLETRLRNYLLATPEEREALSYQALHASDRPIHAEPAKLFLELIHWQHQHLNRDQVFRLLILATHENNHEKLRLLRPLLPALTKTEAWLLKDACDQDTVTCDTIRFLMTETPWGKECYRHKLIVFAKRPVAMGEFAPNSLKRFAWRAGMMEREYLSSEPAIPPGSASTLAQTSPVINQGTPPEVALEAKPAAESTTALSAGA